MSNPADSVGWLPDLLRVAAERLGVPRMLEIAHELGGQQITVPKESDPTHWIARKHGVDVLELLVAYRPGEEIVVPCGPFSNYSRMIQATRKLVEKGVATNDIIRGLGVHVRTVRRHKKRLREAELARDSRQRRLAV